MSRLDGKVAVITGGSSGIGLATARKFVEEGAHVFITGRRREELDKAAKSIGKNVTTVQGDVAKLDDLDRLYETVRTEKGAIDIVVATAGFVESAVLMDATPEHFDKTFDVNARGTFFTVQKALPLLRNGGSVVLLSSYVHALGVPSWSAYSASKAAMRSFARTWAADLKDRGVRVNSVSPGQINISIYYAMFKTRDAADAAREKSGKRCRWADWAPPTKSHRPCSSWPRTTAATRRVPIFPSTAGSSASSTSKEPSDEENPRYVGCRTLYPQRCGGGRGVSLDAAR